VSQQTQSIVKTVGSTEDGKFGFMRENFSVVAMQACLQRNADVLQMSVE